MLRAHRIVGCAKDAEVDQVAENPDFDIMSRLDPNRIDAAFQTDGFFRQAKTDAWKAMNAYTHSGLPQLVRQFSGTQVAGSYDEQDVLEDCGPLKLRCCCSRIYSPGPQPGMMQLRRWNSFLIMPPDHRSPAWQQLPRLSADRPLPACS